MDRTRLVTAALAIEAAFPLLTALLLAIAGLSLFAARPPS